MSNRIALFLFALLLPSTALAQFEGTIEMTVAHRHGGGTMRLLFGKGAVRSEAKIGAQGMQMNMVFLHMFKNPDLAYRIDDAQKTYTEIDLKAAREARTKNDTTYEATKVGVETVRGYSCIHSRLTDASGNESDIWTSKDIANYYEIAKMMGPNAPANEGMTKALKAIGADGFPVKLVHKSSNPDIGDTTMELTKVEKTKPSAALLQLPAGYRKIELRKPSDDHGTHSAGPPGTQLPPELRKKLEEQLKNMSPEEREMAKKMMEQQGIHVE